MRSSVVSAAVRPHSRPVTAAMPETTPSSNRPRGLPRRPSGSGATPRGTALASAITAVSGRGTASPARMRWPPPVRIACASSGCRFQTSGGIRIWVRGSVSGCRLRHSIAPSASCRARHRESCLSGMSSEGSR